jgi:hypothetical protein
MRSYPEHVVPAVPVAGAVTTPVETPQLPLDRVLAMIYADASIAPRRYLSETEVPEGGE